MAGSDKSITRADFIKRAAGTLAFAVFGLEVPSRGMFGTRCSNGRGALEGFPHPEPRPGVTGEHVLAASELGESKKVVAAYEAARTYPELFDGLFCACRCHDSLGHRSLLACFESRQPTGCMGCREEAELVAKMAKDGKTLAEIRTAIDKEYGG